MGETFFYIAFSFIFLWLLIVIFYPIKEENEENFKSEIEKHQSFLKNIDKN